MADKKTFAGPRIKRLRQALGATQAAMAADLGVSPSYLNLVERNQRPLTAQLVLRLAEVYRLDLRELSGESDAKLAAELTEVLADPVFLGPTPAAAEVMEVAAGAPVMGQAFLALYRAYLRATRGEPAPENLLAARDRRPPGENDRFPIEEVRDYFHARSNFIDELDAAAEALRSGLGAQDDLFSALRGHLAARHGVKLSVAPTHVMPDALRRFDRHGRRLLLSELLLAPSRLFQTAAQIGLLEQGPLFDALIAGAGLRTEDARRLCRIGLANYFAGALMMPYAAFLRAATETRYDLDLLAARFGASLEQAAHRLTNLQRRGQSGVPFFLLRVDNAGNVSKRFSAGGFHFARFGGTCPRWRVHDAFAAPGQILVQPVNLPDGATYLTISRTVEAGPAPFPERPRRLAISLGCAIAHAPQVVYGDGLDLANPSAITPIGVTCRMCERHNCPSRAFPPMTRALTIDDSRKNRSAFEFGDGA